MITLDGSGGATAAQFVKGLQDTAQLSAKGTTELRANGFEALALSSEALDANGETQTVTERYLMLRTRSDLRLLRADSGIFSIVTLIP